MKGTGVFGRAEGVLSEAGASAVLAAEICRRAGISRGTYFDLKKNCGGLLPTETESEAA